MYKMTVGEETWKQITELSELLGLTKRSVIAEAVRWMYQETMLLRYEQKGEE
jgi:hypothetical protein